MRAFIFLISILFFFNCKKEVSDPNAEVKTENLQELTTARVTKKEVESIDYTDYGLSSASEKGMSGWASYDILESQVLSIKNGDLSYFEGDEKVIATFIDDLKSTVPKTVYSESVLARIAALETKFYKLKSAVNIGQTPKDQLLQTIKEFFVAFSNLNLQINKKFEKEAQDIFKSGL